MAWTQRPQNRCNACGYTWFPKGKSLARRCPNCGSPNVKIAGCGCSGCGGLIGVLVLLSIISALVLPKRPSAPVETPAPSPSAIPAIRTTATPSPSPAAASPAAADLTETLKTWLVPVVGGCVPLFLYRPGAAADLIASALEANTANGAVPVGS